MVFRGPEAWAEPRQEAWERDMPRGLARDDEWHEVLLRADLAAEKHPRPLCPVPVVLKEAA